MPTLGLPILDRTVQDANAWLGEIADDLGGDRQIAYHALRGVLFALRDRLVPDEALHLGAQLPLLVRGVYYEGYRLADKPMAYDRDAFMAHVKEHLEPVGGADAEAATRAVFGVLDRHIGGGEARQVRGMLPEDLRALWPDGG